MQVLRLSFVVLLFITTLLPPAAAQTPDNIQILGKYGNTHIPNTNDGTIYLTSKIGGAYTGDFVFRSYFGGDYDNGNGHFYNQNVFRIVGKTGFVGIGSNTPNAPLSFGNRLRNTILTLWQGDATSTNTTYSYGLGIQPGQFRLHLGNPGARFSFLSGPAGSELMTIKGNGQVGIGIDSAKVASMPTAHRLVVNGSILSEEVKVQLATNWPDYVFKPAYRLRPLSEVASFIEANGHLPNMPSAAQVEGEGGIHLGEMNARLLEKIEELTLYLIEQQKQLERLQAERKQQD